MGVIGFLVFGFYFKYAPFFLFCVGENPRTEQVLGKKKKIKIELLNKLQRDESIFHSPTSPRNVLTIQQLAALGWISLSLSCCNCINN